MCLLGAAWPARAQAGSYVHIRITGVINPIKARYVRRALALAEQEHAELLLLSIDTPGGLVSSMEAITSALTNSPIPTVGFVEPTSAQATSAGAFILLATDIAAMAPHTQVGAAHPVGPQGKDLDGVMNDKATNSLEALAKSLAARRGRPKAFASSIVRESSSYTAEEAKAAGGVEIIAGDVTDLLSQLNGRALQLGDRSVTLATGKLDALELPLSFAERLLDAIADPTIASMLLTLGVLGIGYELASPGLGMAGIVGAVALLSGLWAMSVLPLALGGALLLIVGLVAIVVDVKAQTHGMLAAGGVVALLVGGLLLVDQGGYFGALQLVDWRVFGPFVAASTALFVALARVAIRSQRRGLQTGVESLVGRRGRAKTSFAPNAAGFEGSVFVDGARWRAVSEVAISSGAGVEVLAILKEPTRLEVKPRDEREG